jgi:hypothetical protein
MSNPGSSKRGPYRKPRADIYTLLLIISLLAIVIGCVFLFLETADYTDKPPWSGGPSARLAPEDSAGRQPPAAAALFAADRRSLPSSFPLPG